MTNADRKYHYSCYNHYDVLRLNWAYWAITLFLSRHVILFMLISISAGRGGGGPRNPELAALLDPILFVSDLPALLLLFLAGARLPKSGRATRFLWRQGRILLLSSLALYVALLLWQQGFDVLGFEPVSWGLFGLNLILMVYVMKSGYLRDLFQQFPAPEPEAEK